MKENTFVCSQCSAVVRQTSKKRSKGCEHYPVKEFSWNDDFTGKSDSRDPTEEQIRAGEIRRRLREGRKGWK